MNLNRFSSRPTHHHITQRIVVVEAIEASQDVERQLYHVAVLLLLLVYVDSVTVLTRSKRLHVLIFCLLFDSVGLCGLHRMYLCDWCCGCVSLSRAPLRRFLILTLYLFFQLSHSCTSVSLIWNGSSADEFGS